MAGCVEMASRVAMRRLVAAADVAAYEAQTQVNPAAADGQAILAAGGGRHDVGDQR
jgi:hypothetical protein